MESKNINFQDEKPKVHVDDIIRSMQNFKMLDYCIFIFMLMVCSFVGIYFAYKDYQNRKGKDQKNSADDSEAINYLMGGRKLHVFPVAMSLVASLLSGISLLGTATEIYLYGYQYILIIIAINLMGFTLYYITIPIYDELKVTSIFEVAISKIQNPKLS